MGMIHLRLEGTFPADAIELSAENGGHANAIARAIAWLNDRLPAAIILDHKLHDAGKRPYLADFGKAPR